MTVREYARQRLVEVGESRWLEDRHDHHWLRVADEAFEHRASADQAGWATRLTRELSSIRAAQERLFERSPDVAVHLAAALGWMWSTQWNPEEGQALLERALATGVGGGFDRARCHSGAGLAAGQRGDANAAIVHLTAAVDAAEHVDDPHRTWYLAFVVYALGAAQLAAGRPEADATLSRAAGLAAELGNGWLEAQTASMLAVVRLRSGQVDDSVRFGREALRLFSDAGTQFQVAGAACLLATALAVKGQVAEAEELAKQGVSILAGLEIHNWLPEALEAMAVVRSRQRRHGDAVRLIAASKAARQRQGYMQPAPWLAGLDAALLDARRHLASQSNAAWTEGQGLDLPGAVALALDKPAPSRRDDLPPTRPRFTRRQLEVASLVAEGLTNAQIGRRLRVTERTAEWHVEEIRNKLGFGSRAQVAAWAARQELEH